MKKYKYFEHTADAKFQAFGKTIEEVFSNSALAMLNLICNTKDITKKKKKEIKISGKNKEALLYNFLEEILFLLDSQNFITSEIKKIVIKKIGGKYILEANLTGDDSVSHSIFGEVKAVTYNQMFIKNAKGKFITQVVVDL